MSHRKNTPRRLAKNESRELRRAKRRIKVPPDERKVIVNKINDAIKAGEVEILRKERSEFMNLVVSAEGIIKSLEDQMNSRILVLPKSIDRRKEIEEQIRQWRIMKINLLS